MDQGRLYADGHFICMTLENPKHKNKIWGDTRISEGTYEIKFRTVGRFHKRYSKRFPDTHIGMLHLQDVRKFKYILIHCGNSKKDTHGCILTGSTEKDYVLANSTSAYMKLYPIVSDAILGGENCSIEIQDEI